MKKFFSTTSLFITVIVLLGIMVGLQQFDYITSASVFNPKSLAATGFIILAAFTMGEFFRAIKIPALLGYIAAGILFGPNLAPLISPKLPTLFSMSVIDDLALINVLTVGVIGTMGGGELQIPDIKGNVKTIFLVIALIFILVVPSTAGTVMLLVEYAPKLVPFLVGTSRESIIAASLLLGVFALAMSPAATLAILQETKAKGKFTSLVLGIVVVADIALVLTFLLTFSFAKILLAPNGFQMEALMEALPGIGAEFGYALLIGIVTGVIYILYMKFVARELMFFTVSVIFAASYASTLLHAETLMAFLTAGFIVQNFSKHGHDMIHSLEKISLPVFVIYFMTQAAQLDLKAVYGFLGVTAVLTVIRGLAFYSGTKIATQWSGAKDNVKQYLWMCFFSRGGVDLVLGAMVASQLPLWGTDFQTVIMAVVVVHIVAGPPLLKLGLDWAGETESAKANVQSVTATIGGAVASSGDVEFPQPNLADRHLQPRMLELRQFLTDLHTTHIAEKFEAQAATIRKYISRLETSSKHSLAAARDVLQRDDYEASATGNAERAKEIRRIRTRYHQSISGLVKELSATKTTVIDEFAVSDILLKIRNEEDFSSTYRVPNQAYYFESQADDSAVVKIIKSFRRLGRILTGSSGIRRVPFGRLWRFYVELGVPTALATAASESSKRNQQLWTKLGIHIREVDRVFNDLAGVVNGDISYDFVASRLTGEDVSTSHDEESDSKKEGKSDNLSSDDASLKIGDFRSMALEVLDLHEKTIQQQREDTLNALADWESNSIRRYTLCLKKPYSDLLSAAYRAGTLELPGFLYRPSLRFDASRTAEKLLHETIASEDGFTEGQKGWIVTDEQSLNFSFWFDLFSNRLSDKLNNALNSPVQSKLEEVEKFCRVIPPEIREYNQRVTSIEGGVQKEETPQPNIEENKEASNSETLKIPKIDWEEWYFEQILPHLERTRNTLEYLRQTFNDASPMTKQARTLEVRIERFAPSLLLIENGPENSELGNDVTRFSLQEWYVQELETAVKLRLSEVNERVRSILQLSLNSISEFEQFVSLNLAGSVDDETAESNPREALLQNTNAVKVLEKCAEMANELSESQAKRVAELRRWLLAQLHDINLATVRPIENRDWRRLNHSFSRFNDLSKRRGAFLFFRRNRVQKGAAPFSVPLYLRLRSNLSHLIGEKESEVSLNEVRSTLRPTSEASIARQNSVPDIYRRLFTPGPLNINGFYVARHIAHNELLTAIDTWRNTPLKSTILIHADRGFGKASLIRHILNVPSLDKVPKLHVRLREDLSSVDDLIHDLLGAYTDDPSSTSTAIETTAIRPVEQHEVLEDYNPALSSYHDVESAIRAIQKASEKPMIIVIENAYKLFNRTEKGLNLCRQFLTLMHETKHHVLWITLFNTSSVKWLETAIEFKSYFSHTIELEPFSRNEIVRLIRRRHPISGFSHSVATTRIPLTTWLVHPIKTIRERRHPQRKFFDELYLASQGSPLLALTYWLNCVELDPQNENNIIVHQLTDTTIDVTEPLTLQKQIILASIIMHGSITLELLADVLQQPVKSLRTELQHLASLGFVEGVAGTNVECFRLKPFAEAIVTPQLRKRNIL